MNQILDIGKRLQLERTRLNFSQTEFAERTGVSRAAQAGYEGGRSLPDLAYALKAQEAGLDLTFLLSGRTSAQTSVDIFDWALAEELLNALHVVADELNITLGREKLIPLLKIFYRLSVDQASHSHVATAREILRIAA